ncbi:histidine kinase [Brevibacillus reuszeri]|uniref:histidine kinase n=2 Tax=Brevibacillus reuszeri TaxID=54915 RepID=A0ABQ0TPF2_9BACL|nr:CHASE3 domain-containing protein [Brevibacillus reuszeri]MED1858726.1 CHASE3 domain-containing protein [Brevibacillus reuszeri]GED69706.1 histidine kinase [Brevibacillus reuszeri]
MKVFHLNIQAKIFMVYVLIVACLGISLVIVNHAMKDLQAEIEFISNHDMTVHELTSQVQKNILDMETGIRGYVITGDEQYLEPYEIGSRSWQDNYSKLYTLLADNPGQQRNLEQIRPLILSWIANTGEYVVQKKREDNQEALQHHFEQHTGKKIMDQLRTQLDSFLVDEKRVTAERIEGLNQSNEKVLYIWYAIIAFVTIITFALSLFLSRSIVSTIKQVVKTIREITDSSSHVDLTARIEVQTKDELQELAFATNDLLGSLERQSWIQKSLTEISTIYQGITDIHTLAKAFVSRLAPKLGAAYGIVYLRKNHSVETVFIRVADYALADQENATDSFRLGEGLVGQCAVDKRIFLIDHLPEDYIKVTSGLGEATPRHLVVAPIMVEGRVEAVVELAAFQPFEASHLTLLDLLQEKFGQAIVNVLGRMEVERLLGESQVMTEELQTQSEELQAQSEELQVQQEQLRMTNEFLEEQNLFAQQRATELQKARDELADYARKLQESSQYKSEFLANMSHELRTPLNSILILSQMLMENDQADQEESEVGEYSRVIYTAGQDLLRLIDDILDLSKIEAGKMEIMMDEVNVSEIPQLMQSIFDPVAVKKQLAFEVHVHPDTPDVMLTDGQRLLQILKNLLSNACKFTEQGRITLRIEPANPASVRELLPELEGETVLTFSVTDTGIGIPADKQELIFEAFQQVDGTTNRQFGGTGLGLSICREFTRLLGGAILVESELNHGSTFTLYIPSRRENTHQAGQVPELLAEKEVAAAKSSVIREQEPTEADTPNSATSTSEDRLFQEKCVLLVDDDARNVYALVTTLERKGIRVEVAENGKQALEILQGGQEYDLVLMDIMMPIMNGYEAMKAIREELGMDELPIIALTAKAMKQEREKCLEAGASDYIMKPLNIDQLLSLMRVWLTK